MAHRSFIIYIALSLFLITCYYPSNAQRQKIEVRGKAIDSLYRFPVRNLQIINKTTRDRYFGDSSGHFRMIVTKLDSLFMVAPGYAPKTISLRDSISKPSYLVLIQMNRIAIELPNIDVQSKRDFEEIQEDAQRLGYNEDDYLLQGYEVLQSPITAIYQQTSRREKDKRGYAKVVNEARKHALLKEILVKYIDLGIITMDPSELDFFIDFCNVPESLLKKSSEYEIVMYLRGCSADFKSRRK